MAFDPSAYGETIGHILALDGGGERLLPLVCSGCVCAAGRFALEQRSAENLFPHSRSPEGALSGLWLYFSCFEECHAVCQDLATPEGSYWHAILHRQEPDAGNAAYWFRRVGHHAVFPALLEAARDVAEKRPDAGLQLGATWDAFRFIDFCEAARQQPGTSAYDAAREVQRAEWQLLFDYCARAR